MGMGGLPTGLVQPQSEESWGANLAVHEQTALQLALRETHDKPQTGKNWGLSKAQPWALDHEQSGNLGLRPKGTAVGYGKLPG